MSHRVGVVVVALCSLASLGRPARADRRAFAGTSEYLTMDRHEVQLDSSITQSYDVFGANDLRLFSLALDVAYGISDRWDLAAFQVYEEAISEDPAMESVAFHYREARVRTRYRLAERGEYPVDVMLQLDAVKPFSASGWGLAPRLSLSRELGQLTAAANLYADVGFGDGSTEVDVGWTAGATYAAALQLALGAEAFGSRRVKGGEQSLAWIGPCVSWAPTHRAWIMGSVAFGVTDASIDLRQQFIIGMTL